MQLRYLPGRYAGPAGRRGTDGGRPPGPGDRGRRAAREQHSLSLRVFFAHELFHRYHYQAAGFSDDLADRQPIWRTLWAEGLTSYASKVLTPGASEREALMLPSDLADRARPIVPQLAASAACRE